MNGPATFRQLDQPRVLTTDEKRIAHHLASALGPAAVAQLDTCEVTGECRCGCSSVSLATRGTTLDPAWAHLGLFATGRRAGGGDIVVTLHLIAGRIGELELFDPERGEGHAVDPSSVTAIGIPKLA